MAYTFLDQQNFLSSLLADSNTDTSSMWPLAQRKTELNHAEKQFAKDSKALLERTTGTASSKIITLPSDWVESFALYVTVGGIKYKMTSARELSPLQLEEGNLYSGDIPYFFYWVSGQVNQVTLVGSSALDSAAFELFYFSRPTVDLSDDADNSEIAEEYRKGPVFLAAASLLLQIGQYTRASALQTQYGLLVAQAKAQYELHYINFQPPSPDVLGLGQDDISDRQGMSQWW